MTEQLINKYLYVKCIRDLKVDKEFNIHVEADNKYNNSQLNELYIFTLSNKFYLVTVNLNSIINNSFETRKIHNLH